MNKIRVLHVNNTLELGGTSYLVRLTRLLDKAVFKNYIAYSGDEFFAKDVDNGVCVYKYSSSRPSIRSLNTVSAPIKLAHFIKEQEIDVVHTYMLPSNLWGLLAGKMAGVPTVNTIVESLLLGQVFSNLALNYKLVRKCFDSLVTRYCALAEYSAREYEARLGVSPSRIYYAGHGVDLERFRFEPDLSSQIRREFSIDKDTRVLASVARMAREKGIDFFLRLLPRIRQGYPDFRYLLVGDGPMLNKLKEDARALKVDDVVVFAGGRYDTDRIFNAIDCHLFTGPRPLLGNANMEAMACGKPLIVYAPTRVDHEIARELVTDGVNGYIARDEDEMVASVLRVLRDRSKTSEMGLNARRVAVDRFDFGKHVRKMEALYLSLVNGKAN